MIKTVLTDIDGTLLDFTAATKIAIENSSKKHGITMPKNIAQIFHPINNRLWAMIDKGEMSHEDLHKNRWNIIFKEIGIDYDGEKFEETFFGEITRSAVPFEGAKELLEFLSENYDVYALTNAETAQQTTRLKSCGLYPYFKGLITSEMLGISKPSPIFFKKCFDMMENPKKETSVMIGDSITADIMGASNFGLRTIHFDPHDLGLVKKYATHRVVNLLEIIDIVREM